MFVYNAMIFGERRTIYLEVQDTMGECSLGFGAEWDIHSFFWPPHRHDPKWYSPLAEMQGKATYKKTLSGRTLPRILRKRELRAPGCPSS